MRTKDLIALLQREDPSGECYVRIDGGIITGAESKQGYWDGPYDYIENGKWIHSIESGKIDIYTMDLEDFVMNRVNTDTCDNWEEIKSLFEFRIQGYSIPRQRQERIDRLLAMGKKAFDKYVGVVKSNRHLFKNNS